MLSFGSKNNRCKTIQYQPKGKMPHSKNYFVSPFAMFAVGIFASFCYFSYTSLQDHQAFKKEKQAILQDKNLEISELEHALKKEKRRSMAIMQTLIECRKERSGNNTGNSTKPAQECIGLFPVPN